MPVEARTIGHFERILYLRKVPAIGTLPAADLGLLAEYARERFFPKGAVLFREGEPVGSVQYLIEGSVHVSRRGRLIGHAGTGSVVGGIGMLARDGEGLEAVAEADTHTLEVGAGALFDLFEDHFRILLHVSREVCRQIIDMHRRAAHGVTLPVPALHPPVRLAAGELDLVERIFFLRQTPVFGRSSINALAELSRGMAEVRFEPGVTLWHEGDPAGWLVLLVEGTVSGRLSTGRHLPLGPGTPPGALETLGDVPRWYTATTETPVLALHGGADGVLDVFEDNFEMATDYLAVMARWLLDGLEVMAAPNEAELQRLYGCAEEPA